MSAQALKQPRPGGNAKAAGFVRSPAPAVPFTRGLGGPRSGRSANPVQKTPWPAGWRHP